MRPLHALFGWVDRVTGRVGFERNMTDEIESHIAARADDLEQTGLSRVEALRQARRQFGRQIRCREAGRDISRYRYLDELHANLRDALRGLVRDRSFAVVATSVIASVLATNMVLFAFLDAYFLRPLPIASADRHVELSVRGDQGRWRTAWPLNDVERILTDDNSVLERGYAFTTRRVIVGGPHPQRAYVEVVSPSYFDLLRPRLMMGRPPAADQHGRPERAVMLSHSGWKRLTASDPAVLGRSLLVDGVSLAVVGVLPEGTGGLEPVTPEFWMLAGAADVGAAGRAPEYGIAGVLREGVSVDQAAAALTPLVRSFSFAQAAPSATQNPEPGTRTYDARVELRTTLLRESRELQPLALSLLLLFGLVTAIAAANLTSLHLARATARRHDLSIRAALGASRGRLIRHLLTESLLVSMVAAVVAWGLSVASVAAVQGIVFSLVSDAGMTMLPVDVDGRIVLAACALAAVVGIGCGLLPALQTTKMDRSLALKRDALWLSGTVSAGRLRGALVVVQVVLSLPLLVGAGILVRSANSATRVDVGYPIDGLIDLRPDGTSARLLDKLRSVPGVQAISVVSSTPLTGGMTRMSGRVNGSELRLGTNEVDDHFFDTLGISTIRGRVFSASEAASRVPVAAISAATARRFWPSQNAIGRTIELEDTEVVGQYRQYEIVGVVADVMSGFFFQGRDANAVYRPGGGAGNPLPDILVRLDRESATSMTALRTACGDVGAFCEPYSFRRILAQQRVPFEVASLIASGLGFLALGLACLGLHGLVRFSVVQRTREFGIRQALGATRRRILLGVLVEAVRRVGWGIGIGLPICLGLSAFIASRVPIVASFDPVAYGFVPLVLLAAALMASVFPALRAASTDPIRALREQ